MTDRRLLRVLPIERWPTREEARAMRWFSPGRLGRQEAKTRTWVPAMVPWRASDEGEVTPAVLEWYRRFAVGRPGVLVVEATGIRDVPSGPLLRIGHDRFLPGLRSLVDTVREASRGETLLLIQLIDFLTIRRRPPRERFYRRYLPIDEALRARAATKIPRAEALDEAELRDALLKLDPDEADALLDPRQRESLSMGYRERITDVHLPHIQQLPSTLPNLFSEAAARAEQAGFHGVELHYAHAYTMASFLSARNDRSDGYGGSLEGRVRAPVEVLEAVRRQTSKSFVVGLRYLGDEVIEGGSTLEDALYFAERFAAGGADFLSVSKGGKFEDAKQPKVGHAAYPYTGPSGHECMPTARIAGGAFGRNVPLARAVREAIRGRGHEVPVVTSGGIASPWQAEDILRRGDADFVAAARQTLCDPDWFEKTRTGLGAEVRRCFFTNYCEALDQAHKEVTCQRWDRVVAAGEEEVLLAHDGRRRLTAPPWAASRP